mgnify:CR=1 FL=1
MFRGATLVNLDSKGRLSVPTVIGNSCLRTLPVKWFAPLTFHHPCLLLYPLPEWEIIEQKIIASVEHEPG